jgi:hypothetical protein
LVDGFDLLPFLGLDKGTSLLKPVDNFGVVKGESDLSNLDISSVWPIDSVVWEVV